MCGIFGAVNLNRFFNKDAFQQFVELTNLVGYRGPDASGYHALNVKKPSSSCSTHEFDIFLGHRRLSIIDLAESANQPMTDGNGIWIVYNGEIFNYIELKRELERKGHVFKTQSDTEVILKVYREYSTDGFAKLNGMWAFAIVDLPRKKVVLSRDRFSIKPLYITRKENELYFASEIKQLLPLLGKKDMNRDVMFTYLNQGLMDYGEETFYRGITKIQPKHNFIIQLENSEIVERKYWDYSFQPEQLTLEDAAEQFRALFVDSVKIRLRSDVPIGALLSGGLDSSTIAVVANELQGGNFETYSVISEDKRYNEEKFIDVLSSSRNLRNRKLHVRGGNIIDKLNDVMSHYDEPFGCFGIVAHYNMLEKIKMETGLKVVLSGQGGDEVLLGYLKFFFFHVKKLLCNGHLAGSLNQIFRSFIEKTVIWQFNLAEARRYMPFFGGRGKKSFLRIEGPVEPIYKCSSLRERQMLDIDKYSVPSLALYEDRNAMLHSMEIRLPFLDYRLVNFLINLPVSMKLNRGWTKYLLRETFHELPEAIRWRRDKQGFVTPEEAWLKKDFSALINEIFNESVLHEMNIIDSKRFLRYYRDFQDGKKSIWFMDIARTIIAELWARKNFCGSHYEN